MRKDVILGWHCLRGNRELRYFDGRQVQPGKIVKQPDMRRRPSLCDYGMHAALDLEMLVSSFPWLPGYELQSLTPENEHYFWLCRVAVKGSLDQSSWYHRFRKATGKKRFIMWMVKIDRADRTRLVEARDNRVKMRNIILGIKRRQKPREYRLPRSWRVG